MISNTRKLLPFKLLSNYFKYYFNKGWIWHNGLTSELRKLCKMRCCKLSLKFTQGLIKTYYFNFTPIKSKWTYQYKINIYENCDDTWCSALSISESKSNIREYPWHLSLTNFIPVITLCMSYPPYTEVLYRITNKKLRNSKWS